MIDRADTETVLYRVAISAFTYYPGKEAEEPGYTVEEDLAWCLAPLAAHPAIVDELRTRIRLLITDPTADRRGFLATLAQLAGDH
ncbi:hypothetical protein [Microbacterium sp.]|uniref:hypothetical protein n=1 Tax=Microbacterium sp. TaxID=51671 RepID=UPI0037C7F69E